MMKKMIMILTIVVMGFGFTGCGAETYKGFTESTGTFTEGQTAICYTASWAVDSEEDFGIVTLLANNGKTVIGEIGVSDSGTTAYVAVATGYTVEELVGCKYETSLMTISDYAVDELLNEVSGEAYQEPKTDEERNVDMPTEEDYDDALDVVTDGLAELCEELYNTSEDYSADAFKTQIDYIQDALDKRPELDFEVPEYLYRELKNKVADEKVVEKPVVEEEYDNSLLSYSLTIDNEYTRCIYTSSKYGNNEVVGTIFIDTRLMVISLDANGSVVSISGNRDSGIDGGIDAGFTTEGNVGDINQAIVNSIIEYALMNTVE